MRKRIIMMGLLGVMLALPACAKKEAKAVNVTALPSEAREKETDTGADALTGSEAEKRMETATEALTETVTETEKVTEELQTEPGTEATVAADGEAEANAVADITTIGQDSNKKDGDLLHFVDVFGQEYQTVIRSDVPKHSYRPENFVRNGSRLSYHDEQFSSRLGVDVSHHQGQIDWQKVKADGYDFAILRIGYRGYGAEGALGLDREFERNVEEAVSAGLEVGVYFFAQAVNEQEALEEAEFVLQHLQGHAVTLPVVYDPESILGDEARTDNVTGEQFTKNTRVFCERIRQAGYQPMVYANMLWEAFELDLAQLSGYPLWYADYEPLPQTPYQFAYWQYTNEGRVDGIAGNVDINLQMLES